VPTWKEKTMHTNEAHDALLKSFDRQMAGMTNIMCQIQRTTEETYERFMGSGAVIDEASIKALDYALARAKDGEDLIELLMDDAKKIRDFLKGGGNAPLKQE